MRAYFPLLKGPATIPLKQRKNTALSRRMIILIIFNQWEGSFKDVQPHEMYKIWNLSNFPQLH